MVQPDPGPSPKQRAVGIALLAVMLLVAGYFVFLAVAFFTSGGGA